MKRLTALLTALLLVFSCAAAEGPEVFSYDYDLKLGLDPGAFPLADRHRMQGFADLLDSLAFKGNFATCPDTRSSEMHLELIPEANPKAAVSLQMRFLPWWWRVSSSLLGPEENSISFMPEGFMAFAYRAWFTFLIPLTPVMLLYPDSTLAPIRELAAIWKEEAGMPEQGRSLTVNRETLERIAERWREAFRTNTVITDWIDAVCQPKIGDYESLESEMTMIPELLGMVAGNGGLTVASEGEWIRCTNENGDVIFGERTYDNGYECFLTPPPCGGYYVPSFRILREKTDKGTNCSLEIAWERPSMPNSGWEEGGYESEEEAGEAYEPEEETEGRLPDTLVKLKLAAEGLPEEINSDASFTGTADCEGILLPNFHLRMTGETKAAGDLGIGIYPAEGAGEAPVMSCEGTVKRVQRSEPLDFYIGDVVTDFRVFTLSDQSLSELVNSVRDYFLTGALEFVAAVPTSGIQSILDTLEQYGILQTLMAQ